MTHAPKRIEGCSRRYTARNTSCVGRSGVRRVKSAGGGGIGVGGGAEGRVLGAPQHLCTLLGCEVEGNGLEPVLEKPRAVSEHALNSMVQMPGVCEHKRLGSPLASQAGEELSQERLRRAFRFCSHKSQYWLQAQA